MIATAILLIAVAIASVTDARERKIYNWTTYPGLLAALLINGGGSLAGLEPESKAAEIWGWIGIDECLKGLLVCGGLMVVSFVLFGLGGGDVKLLAMTGAFLGFDNGLEVLLWTFLFGGMLGAIILIWQVGAVTLAKFVVNRIAGFFGRHPFAPLTEDQQRYFRSELFLAPCAGAAAALLKLGWLPNL